MDLFMKTFEYVEQALKDAGLDKNDVQDIVVAGGSARIPKVVQLIKEYFNGKDVHKGISPDEVVAMGAAIQGGFIQGSVLGTADPRDSFMFDVNYLALGIETYGGVMTKMIPRNTYIPVKKFDIFSTIADNQSTVLIPIYEGERSLTKHNIRLGQLELNNVPPTPRGVPLIEVSFEIDANNVFRVLATVIGTGKTESIIVKPVGGNIPYEEVERRIKEAEQFSDEDTAIEERIEAKNMLENYLYTIKSQVNNDAQLGAKIEPEDRKTILETVHRHIKWFESESTIASKEQLDSKRKEMEDIAAPIAPMLRLCNCSRSLGPSESEKIPVHDEL
ncbi:ATPase with role in protein import into the ER [Actinomortierella ambigua]|nr:ATPase with role in protein import into the ER [Actinomortierella ambigua]